MTTPRARWCGGRGCPSARAAGTGSGVAVPVPRALPQAGVGGIAAGRADQIQLSLTEELPF